MLNHRGAEHDIELLIFERKLSAFGQLDSTKPR
jgi:hypothetical protein